MYYLRMWFLNLMQHTVLNMEVMFQLNLELQLLLIDVHLVVVRVIMEVLFITVQLGR